MVEIIEGIIDRRILVNYRIDPSVLRRILPEPFEPRLIGDHALGGICLIRFKKMRPAGMPQILGTSSENGTHRFCVQWKDKGKLRTGIYVKRRFSNSRLHVFGSDRVFPGSLDYAHFQVEESDGHYRVEFRSDDGAFAKVQVHETQDFPTDSIFENIEAASSDFEQDKIGFSPAKTKGSFKGVQLNTNDWSLSPLAVKSVHSSLFLDTDLFPSGSTELDHSLLMKNIKHSWQDVETICCS